MDDCDCAGFTRPDAGVQGEMEACRLVIWTCRQLRWWIGNACVVAAMKQGVKRFAFYFVGGYTPATRINVKGGKEIISQLASAKKGVEAARNMSPACKILCLPMMVYLMACTCATLLFLACALSCAEKERLDVWLDPSTARLHTCMHCTKM